MRKSTLFIICLLCIVIAELVMVFKSGVGGQTQQYALDTKVYDMPVRDTEYKVVKPFLFEMHAADEVDAILDEFAADITQSMVENANQQKLVAPQEVVVQEPESEVLQIEDESLSDVAGPSIEEAVEVQNNVEEVIPEEKAEPVAIIEEITTVEVTEPEENAENTPIAAPENIIPEAVAESVTEAEPVVQEEIKPAEEAVAAEKRDKIAIVIDDVGLSTPFTKEIAKVKAPLTVSFLPYGASNKEQVMTLKDAGFEVMVHVPMMPHVPAALAPVTLSPEMDKAETQAELNKMLDRFAGTPMSGVNNHMGSLLTERVKNMEYIMEVLKQRGLFFLDSKTTGKSMARKAADEYGVTYISRDVFLDNKNDYNYIMGQFRQAEKTAHKNGYAVAIGHPYSQTLAVLKDWLKETDKNGIEVVHLSELLPR